VTWGGAFALARRNLSHNRRGALLSALGVAIGVGCLTFFTGLGQGISSVVRTRIFPMDQATVEVVPPQLSLGSLFSGGRLDDAMVKRLRALPGVADAFPKMSVRVSAVSRYDGDFFGRPLHMGLEIIAIGVDPRIVEKDLAKPERFVDSKPGQPIPVVVSSRLLELYNKAFAAQRGLPTLSAALLNGFRIPAEFGLSFVTATEGRSQAETLEVVGFSERALLGGVTIPLATAQRLNRAHGKDAESYSSVVLRAASPDALPGISAAVREMGFDVDDSEQRLGEQIGWGILVVTAALALLSGLITALAAINITHAFYAAVRERRREIGILRAVGASRNDVMRTLMVEASFVGVTGAVAGILGGLGLALLCDFGARRWLPDFPFKPESFFQFSPVLILAAALVGTAAALLGAFGPARSAAYADPAAALSE
jgi:ABC-type antimicrobial peptide transport system permease subunit